MPNETKICERCTAVPATKVFFLFNPDASIKTTSAVCDVCFYEAGFEGADPKYVEVFPANRHLVNA